ncbi:MAG: MFS transporter [Pseudomonadales bacterium]
MNGIIKHYPALANPSYRRYWLGSFASVGATQLLNLGQGWLVFELSGSALALGLLGFAAAVPSLLMMIFGGVIADRFDKRRILMLTSMATAVALVVLTLLDLTEVVRVWHVLLIAALISLITGLDWPTRSAMFPLLVERPAYMSAVALNAFIWQSTRMMIPALGGLLLAFTDTWVVFALGAAGFVIMFCVLMSLHVPHEPKPAAPALQQVAEGFRFIRQTPLFATLLALTFTGMLLSNAYVQILPVFADLLGRGETAYGTLLSAGGVGSVIGTVLMGGAERLRRLGQIMLGSATAMGLLLALFAWAADGGYYYAAILLVLITAIFSSAFMVLTMTVMQLLVPDDLRGRVMGIYSMGFSLMPLGGLLLGAVSEFSSPALAVIAANLVFVLIVAVIGWRQRLIRALSGSDLHAPLSRDDVRSGRRAPSPAADAAP